MTTPHPSEARPPRLLARGLSRLGAAALAALFLLPAGVAHAAPDRGSARSSPMTSYLCSSKRVPCTVRVSDHLREGAAEGVYVTGRPSAVVEVQLFRLDVVGGRIRGMSPLGRPTTVTLSSRGQGRGTIPVAPFGPGDKGGWGLVSLADARWHGDAAKVVGQVVPIGGRAPTVLGDGYGTEKPVGTALDMEIANYIPDTQFTVEYLGDDGSWHNVTIGTEVRRDASQPVMVLRYSVPNGLLAKPHRFRAHNVTDPSAIDSEWAVVPSVDALPQPRAPLLDPPELGSDVTTSLSAMVHSSQGVIAAAALLGLLGSGAIVLWPALAIGRRRVGVGPR